jgi:nitrite reductase/ring-hydroxylating ferredoxin subunit
MTIGSTVVDLGPSDQFVNRRVAVVSVKGKELGVLVWDGSVFVVRNICAHQGAPVCRGEAVSELTADVVGEPTVNDARPVLICPWHRWEYSLPSGVAIRSKEYRIRSYPAWIDNGRVLADLGPAKRPANVVAESAHP